MQGLPPITIATVDTGRDFPVIALLLIVVDELHHYWRARQTQCVGWGMGLARGGAGAVYVGTGAGFCCSLRAAGTG